MTHMIKKIKVLRKSTINFFKNNIHILIPFYLALMNFIGFRSYWNSILVALTFVLVILHPKKIIDKNVFILIFYMSFYIYFLSFHNFNNMSRLTTILYFLLPLVYYFLGKYIAMRIVTYEVFYILLASIIFFLSIIPFISNVIDIINTGFMKNRNITLLFSDTETAATNIGALFSLNMILSGVLLLGTESIYETKFKKISFFLFCMGIISVANMSTRTGFFLAAISLIFTILFVLFVSRVSIKKTFLNTFLLTILVIVAFYSFGFFEWLPNSYLYSRFTDELAGANFKDLETLPRVFRWGRVIEGVFINPFGGKPIFIGNYAHNLWLDVIWKVGFIPLIPLIIFTLNYLNVVKNLVLKKNISPFFRLVVMCISIGFILSFMVEPIMEGYFVNFCLWAFFAALFKDISMRANSNKSLKVCIPFKQLTPNGFSMFLAVV